MSSPAESPTAGPSFFDRRGARRAFERAWTTEGGVLGLVLFFMAVTVWWLSVDNRFPDGDSAKHLNYAFTFADALRDGSPISLLLAYTGYPPLAHTVGAIGSLIGGTNTSAVVMAENMVFVPLLALGCYGAGRVAFDRRVGLLAVTFAFASPMVISLFHLPMLDAPTAAMVAMSVWLLLASARFSRPGICLLAGLVVGLGLLLKTTLVLFVAGLILMMLIRGGWRNWRGFLLFVAVVLILVEPWYSVHYVEIRGLTTGAVEAQQVLWYEATPYPARGSLRGFGWYLWSGVNTQMYVPLMALFVGGTFAAGIGWLRSRSRSSYVPELIAGLLVGWLGVTMISLKDPRYSLPALVYMAVLGTAWMVRLPRVPRLLAIGVLVAIFGINTVFVNTSWGGRAQIRLPWHEESPIAEGTLTFANKGGYFAGEPIDRPLRLESLLEEARKDGAIKVVFQPESLNGGGFNLFGLAIFARQAGLEVPGFDPAALGPQDLYVFRAGENTVKGQRPCLLASQAGGLDDGTGIFFMIGRPPYGHFYCPESG